MAIKNIMIQNCQAPINVEDITLFEKIIDNSLPKDYSSWLLKYNGGKPEKESTFKITDNFHENDGYESVKYFFAICNNDTYSLEAKYYNYQNRIPKELIPIANDPFGNKVCLGIKGKHFNKVYFWDHENEVMEDNQEPWWDNVYLIANTFADFINKLFYAEVNEEEWKKNKRIVYTYHPPSSDFS